MKSFYTAAVIMLLIIAFIITLSFFISSSLDDIYAGISSLPAAVYADDGTADIVFCEILELTDKWNEHKTLVGLTASYNDVLRADTEMRNIGAFAKFADAANYCAARSRLLEALDTLRKTERLSWDNVL